MSTPKGATPLGRYLYLFKSKTNSTDCIISAHGGYMFESNTFAVPKGVELKFYSPHSSSLMDPGLGSFQRKESRAVPVEVISGGQTCKDYLLNKYQGYHGNEDETYESIANGVLSQDMVRGSLFTQLMRAGDTRTGDAGKAQRLLLELGREYGGSVLTVRNRWDVVFGIKLSDAIAAVRKESPTIRVFYCIFCRANMMGDDKYQPGTVRYAA